MADSPPAFRYHPQPRDTGAVLAGGAARRSCSLARGLGHAGPDG